MKLLVGDEWVGESAKFKHFTLSEETGVLSTFSLFVLQVRAMAATASATPSAVNANDSAVTTPSGAA